MPDNGHTRELWQNPILCGLRHALFERHSVLKRRNEGKTDRKKDWKCDVCVCCMHDLWGPRRKGAWRKRNRGGDCFKGERCWFFCSVQRSGRSGMRGAQGRGSLVVRSALAPPAPTALQYPEIPATPPDLCPAAARVSLWLALMKPPAPSPADWVACVHFASFSTRPCASAEAQHIEPHIHTFQEKRTRILQPPNLLIYCI